MLHLFVFLCILTPCAMLLLTGKELSMEKHQKAYLLNAFLLGACAGFLFAPIKKGIQVRVRIDNKGLCDKKEKEEDAEKADS